MGRLFALVRAPAFMIADDLLQVAFKMFFGINADGIGNELHSVMGRLSYAACGFFTASNWDAESKSCSVVFKSKRLIAQRCVVRRVPRSEQQFIICYIVPDNPLHMFVELPSTCSNLQYSNLICGVIRGALNMVSAVSHLLESHCSFVTWALYCDQVNMVVDCTYVQSELKGKRQSSLLVPFRVIIFSVRTRSRYMRDSRCAEGD